MLNPKLIRKITKKASDLYARWLVKSTILRNTR
ncbi:hypothetical protein EPIR_2948 [Erwinia piriflorinigrans CFBP 5888]|uniref:Uncharacterized protein n=1 Tax=Erwinia piriflorinigrans CFBP 5888 TaxID=1161919 RepID=V5ZBL9_9GAMM|nr:hypothetical protein EPIR_2948 [Erwinia piriflorinigrans CFBP 5888]